VRDFERDLFRFMDSVGKNVTAKIAKDKAWSADIEKEVRAMLDEFKKTTSYADKPAPAKADAGRPAAKADAKPEAKKPEPAKAHA
jgi:hypothetical protein